MTKGIYILQFSGTHKLYVGQSLHIESRFKEHINELKNGTHTKKMQEAYSLFGYPSLEIEIVIRNTIEDMDNAENYYISLWDSVRDGFNTLANAAGGSLKGGNNSKALYSDKEYVSVLMYIVNNPGVTLAEVGRRLNISYNVVKSISNGTSHKWLQEYYPTEYANMLNLIGTRNNCGDRQGSSTYSNEQISTAFFLALENPLLGYKKISEAVGVTETVVAQICTGKGYLWLKTTYPQEHDKVVSAVKAKKAYSRSAAARGITYPPVISPSGEIHYITNVNAFSKLRNLDTGSMNRLLNGKAKSVKGWKVYTTEEKMPA
jgi:hypothetical protein